MLSHKLFGSQCLGFMHFMGEKMLFICSWVCRSWVAHVLAKRALCCLLARWCLEPEDSVAGN